MQEIAWIVAGISLATAICALGISIWNSYVCMQWVEGLKKVTKLNVEQHVALKEATQKLIERVEELQTRLNKQSSSISMLNMKTGIDK